MKVPNLFWMPPWCRWDNAKPRPFTLWLNILFAFAGAFTSATLFYSHPILNVIGAAFHTDEAGVANVPTLALAGEATGLLLVLPLADFFPRRGFTLTLVTLSALFWIGLCITRSLDVFLVLTYFSAVFTGATQIMIPLVSELSSDDTRAFNIAIVAAGPTLGIMIARILSGIVANYTAWRNVYWLALVLQFTVIIGLWTFMPDYPACNPTNTRNIVKTYPRIIWSIVMLYRKYPVLVQASLLSFCTMFTVSSYWTTLTFLLADPPYQYSSMIVGLFGLIGAATMVLGPVYGKYIIRPLKQPLLSIMIGKGVCLVAIVVGTYAGTRNVSAPLLQALLLDAGLMIVQVSLRISIHPVEPLGRNRVNTAFVSVMYVGMLCGAKAGNVIYAQHGGWIASGSLSVAVILFSYVIIAARGPHETGWFGWSGGWGINLKEKEAIEEDGLGVVTINAEMAEVKV